VIGMVVRFELGSLSLMRKLVLGLRKRVGGWEVPVGRLISVTRRGDVEVR
jgi:hypothetical protein